MADPVKPFREISASDLHLHSIKHEMEAHGYVLIRNLLPLDELNSLLAEFTQIVDHAGWLIPGTRPIERISNPGAACGEPDPSFKQISKQAFCLESFHAFFHRPALAQAMRVLTGPNLIVHPKPVVRTVFPDCEHLVVREHQDHTAIGGDSESFTAWMPLHDCPPSLGPLRILSGSHRFGLLETPRDSGVISRESLRGENWVGGNINAGDVLIFHSLTVHAATPNLSHQLRISMDCRFQSSDRPISPSELVFSGKSADSKSWESTYANWRSDDLKYYWKKLPLKLKPSHAELVELAQTAAPEMMRARWERILRQLELEVAASTCA